MSFTSNKIPIRGVEPRPSTWKADILTARPYGMQSLTTSASSFYLRQDKGANCIFLAPVVFNGENQQNAVQDSAAILKAKIVLMVLKFK